MTTRTFYNRRRAAAPARCAAMRAAKERKRIAQAAAVDVVEVGIVRFSGPAFGGEHEIRLRHRTGADALLVECDGRELRPRTQRGFVAMLGRNLWRRATSASE